MLPLRNRVTKNPEIWEQGGKTGNWGKKLGNLEILPEKTNPIKP